MKFQSATGLNGPKIIANVMSMKPELEISLNGEEWSFKLTYSPETERRSGHLRKWTGDRLYLVHGPAGQNTESSHFSRQCTASCILQRQATFVVEGSKIIETHANPSRVTVITREVSRDVMTVVRTYDYIHATWIGAGVFQ